MPKTAPQPTAKQCKLFEDAIAMWASTSAEISTEMDEDGTMLLNVKEDGLLQIARFDTNGVMVGDWF